MPVPKTLWFFFISLFSFALHLHHSGGFRYAPRIFSSLGQILRRALSNGGILKSPVSRR
jgi:hypothetical protein